MTRKRHRKQKQSKQSDHPESVTRRNFLRLGLGALSSLALLEIGGASFLFMQPRDLEGTFGGVVTTGAVDSFPLNSVTEFPDGRFYLIRDDAGHFLAVYNRCTHLGCTVSWKADQNHFFCPCHASRFDIHGDVENPPAPRALDLFPVAVEDGQVIVDTGKPQQRDRYQPEQSVTA